MSFPKISVLRTDYSILSRAEVTQFLLAHGLKGGSGYVCVWNVHTTMMALLDLGYQRIGNSSLLTVPDGMPLVWAMRSLGASGQDRVRGPTLMRDLIREGQALQARHYLYGGSSETLADLRRVLAKDYPLALVVGAESPPFRAVEEIPAREWQEIAERINASGAQFLWVGLGAPKQERWMWELRERVRPVMLGVGAAFDLLPGRVPEAPALLQALGLEWAYRLAKEPRRLWKRYILNNPIFLALWASQWIARLAGKDFRK